MGALLQIEGAGMLLQLEGVGVLLQLEGAGMLLQLEGVDLLLQLEGVSMLLQLEGINVLLQLPLFLLIQIIQDLLALHNGILLILNPPLNPLHNRLYRCYRMHRQFLCTHSLFRPS